MSLWKNLEESYTINIDSLKDGYPLSSTSISNNTGWIAVIIINGEGEFQRAYKIEKPKRNKKTNEEIVPDVSINVPVTEKSVGRTSGPEPHPLFDQFEYLKGTGKKFDLYCKQLNTFANSDFALKQIKAIHAYISKRTVESDLKNLAPDAKTNIIFEVQVSGSPQSKIWQDKAIYDAWHSYYLSTKTDTILDIITGAIAPLAESHPKKIANTSANSKLISANDTSNFTFRGRFEDVTQALSIGYEASQKSHQFLRYLVNHRGILCGEQIILTFSVGSIENSLPDPLEDTEKIWSFISQAQPQTETDKQITLHAKTGFDYANALRNALAGFQHDRTLQQHPKTVVLVLNAPSDGRMSVTFYRELARNEYLEKIAGWHEDCKWNQNFGNNETQRFVVQIGAPSVDRIIEAVYGKPRGTTDDSYIKTKKTARERLLRCIFDNADVPTDFIASAVRRASNPLAIAKKNGGFDRNGFMQLQSTACALVRKDFKQRKKEDYTLSLEPTRTDRDYLYGRLLGAADKLEEYALHKKDNDRMVTAAIRHMQTFVQRPFRTWQTIHACLNPYIQTVKGSFAFNEIQSVMELFKSGEFEKDTPLNGSYLIGYYHERAYIDNLAAQAKTKKPTKTETLTEENHE